MLNTKLQILTLMRTNKVTTTTARPAPVAVAAATAKMTLEVVLSGQRRA